MAKSIKTKEQTLNIDVLPDEEEKRLVQLLSDGKKVDEIVEIEKSERWYIGEKLMRMRQKFGVKNSTQMVALFLRNKIIQ